MNNLIAMQISTSLQVVIPLVYSQNLCTLPSIVLASFDSTCFFLHIKYVMYK